MRGGSRYIEWAESLVLDSTILCGLSCLDFVHMSELPSLCVEIAIGAMCL